jgi:hypothetical protein
MVDSTMAAFVSEMMILRFLFLRGSETPKAHHFRNVIGVLVHGCGVFDKFDEGFLLFCLLQCFLLFSEGVLYRLDLGQPLVEIKCLCIRLFLCLFSEICYSSLDLDKGRAFYLCCLSESSQV